MTRRGNISVDLSALLRERAPSLPNFLAGRTEPEIKWVLPELPASAPPFVIVQFFDTVEPAE